MSGNRVVAVAAVGFALWLVGRQVKAATRRMSRDDVLAIIDRLNREEFGSWFDPLDVVAVVEIESSRDPDAYRYEEHLDDASIGLMQVLYSTARDRGFSQAPAALFDPVTNVRIGMRHLKWSFDYLSGRLGVAPTRDQWFGSYNAGVGNVMKGFLPHAYLAKFRGMRAGL